MFELLLLGIAGVAFAIVKSNASSEDDFESNSFESTSYSDGSNENVFDNDSSACQVNPANGLPMVDGCGGIDVAGNPYGTDSSDDWSFSDHSCSSFNEDYGSCSSFNDDF